MNALQSKIAEAANLFQTHDFKRSLQLYQQCISTCKKNQQPKTLLYNLMSVKGALMSILGDQKGALQCLDEVLTFDPYHNLCLFRRSQIYKKKNKLNKALKDLKMIGSFAPDNLQIAAFRVQIQNLKLKSKVSNSSSESEDSSKDSNQQSIDIDEEEKLNFANLKKIDRKSVSIMFRPQRKSRVTIAGDIAIEYQAIQDDSDNKSFPSTNISKQYAKQKYVKTFKEIELDDDDGGSSEIYEQPIIKVKSTTSGRTKSILKNRDSAIYLSSQLPVQKQKKYGGRQSKMIDLLKNIDGKVITNGSERSSTTGRQVEFRKSIFGSGQEQFELNSNISQNLAPKKKSGSRKSCLKRSSFQVACQSDPSDKNAPRRSKFQRMSQVGIDGIVIKSKRSSVMSKQTSQGKNNSDSDDDEHNIFGSNQVVISEQVKQTLGLKDRDSIDKKPAKPRGPGGKSILKKNSILQKTVERIVDDSPIKEAKKAKKSVMFTRFE